MHQESESRGRIKRERGERRTPRSLSRASESVGGKVGEEWLESLQVHERNQQPRPFRASPSRSARRQFVARLSALSLSLWSLTLSSVANPPISLHS